MAKTIKKKAKTKKKMGRPIKTINWKQVDQCCKVQCTQDEIAAILGVGIDTLTQKCKEDHGITFQEYSKHKSAGGKMSIRRKQFARANKGSDTMLIWLGKQYLGQKDKVEHGNDTDKPFNLVYMTDKKLVKRDLDND